MKNIFVLLCCIVFYSPHLKADESWDFIQISCNKDLSYFSLNTFQVWNPSYEGMAKDSKIVTAHELQNSPFICDLTKDVIVEVKGYCMSGAGECAPGFGPAAEGFAVFINGKIWPLKSGYPPSKKEYLGWIEYTQYRNWSVSNNIGLTVKTYENGKGYVINARHCRIEDKVAPMYSDIDTDKMEYESLKSYCGRYRFSS